MGKVTRGLAEMDKELGANPWCATTSYSLADIAVGCCTGWLDFRFPQLGWQKLHPNLARHAAKLAERPTFADTTPRE
jgi:glutathione S-transferase